jgi:hypothetical protein
MYRGTPIQDAFGIPAPTLATATATATALPSTPTNPCFRRLVDIVATPFRKMISRSSKTHSCTAPAPTPAVRSQGVGLPSLSPTDKGEHLIGKEYKSVAHHDRCRCQGVRHADGTVTYIPGTEDLRWHRANVLVDEQGIIVEFGGYG